MILLTNNIKFLNEKSFLDENSIELSYKEKDYIGILEEARDMIHSGYELLTHPLYGSVKPNETLYRSLVLRKSSQLDFTSLSLIEEAIMTAEKFKKNKMTPLWTEEVKDDFRVIDFDLMSKTIYRIIN